MLSIEEVHCSEEMERRPYGAFATRGTVLMLDDDTRLITDGPSRRPRAQAPVQILTIHEESLVEQPDTLDYRPPHQHACAAHRVDLQRLVGIDERPGVAAESPAR